MPPESIENGVKGAFSVLENRESAGAMSPETTAQDSHNPGFGENLSIFTWGKEAKEKYTS